MIRPVQLVPLEARLFRSLGDEGRLAIVETLVPTEQRVSDLVQSTHLSQSTVSTHLSALHGAGLVAKAGGQAGLVWARPSVGRHAPGRRGGSRCRCLRGQLRLRQSLLQP